MYSLGEKVMVKGSEIYGIGEITHINYFNFRYDIYFKDTNVMETNVKQDYVYPIAVAQLNSYSLREIFEKLSTQLNKIKPIWEDFNMSCIKNYKYTEDTAVTTIEWSDGTKTTVHAEHPDAADPYTGFVTACAKKAFGNDNTINKLFDEWAVKKPKREEEAKIKAIDVKAEENRIAEKRRVKRAKWLIRKRAAEIAKEYEARKLANEKYGVPMDDKKGE